MSTEKDRELIFRGAIHLMGRGIIGPDEVELAAEVANKALYLADRLAIGEKP